MAHARYSRWDGTQEPFGPDLPTAELLEELADDVLMGEPAEAALRRLLGRGIPGKMSGLEALRRRLRQRREQQEAALDLTGPLEDIRARLDEVIERERTRLSFEPGEEARLRETSLDALPPDVAGRIRELRDYRFIEPEAQRAFDELLGHLQEQVLGSFARSLARGLGEVTPEQLTRVKDMLADLNGLLEQRSRGQDTQPAFEDFMARHGDLVPGRPRTLEELIEEMARRMAATSRLMASLTPGQRAELQDLIDQVMQDMDLAFEMDRLGANLRGAMPGMPWDEPTWAAGDDALPMSATIDELERLRDLEELERALDGDYPGASLDDIDEEALRRTLGETSVHDLRRLKRIERALEDAGLVQRREGRLEITPRGARTMGERALTKVFERLARDREGTHEARDPGGLAEPTGQTRPWRFGDHGQIAVQRSVFNAVVRGGRDASGTVRLDAEDFELVEAEQRTETATALLLDLSFSMPLRGHLIHAKKMALALHALIEGRFPHDTLYLIGFSDYARRLTPTDLAAPGFERTYGTNMQHAFLLAGRLLGQHPRAQRQVIMVTDGEPTAHLVGEEASFAWPPEPETIQATLAEAVRLSRSGVTLNIFMLERSEGLSRFMERLARLTGGRVFLIDDERVGDFVLRDYVRRAAGSGR